MTDLPPALVLLLGALILPLFRGKARWVVALALSALALAHSWWVIDAGTQSYLQFMGMTINPVRVHDATPVFATIFCVMIAGGMLFGLNQDRRVELPAAFVYAGGALGVVFAGDLISMFVFWEIMTLGSTTIIWSGRQQDSYGAGLRYFGMHALGGVALMMGIIIVVTQRMHAGDADPLAFRHFGEMVTGWSSLGWGSAGMWLIMIGMLVNAGAPPFSSWITDAYPEGSPSGTVFLSAFTTKTAVFTLLVAFAGVEPLIYLGVYMALYGVIYGILENDMRRLLCYSLVNQVGFMLIGIGVGTELALNGAAAHAFAHIVYKALLLMATGSVVFMTGKRKLGEVGGLFRTMPITMWCCIIGGLSISAFPLTSGFTAKSMTVAGLVSESARIGALGEPNTGLVVTWFLFQLATAGVFLDACVKLSWFVFFQKDSGLRPKDPPWNMRWAMLGFAAICIGFGIFPQPLYAILPYPGVAADYWPHVYTLEHVIMMLGMLMFAGLSFFVLLPLMKRTPSITLDVDWIWRRFIPKFWKEVVMPLLSSLNQAQQAVLENLPGRGIATNGLPAPISRRIGSAWAVSVPVFTIMLMLLAYLVIYFVLPGL